LQNVEKANEEASEIKEESYKRQIAEQKAEIERLTGYAESFERGEIGSPIIMDEILALEKDKIELQKQVDEQDKEIDRLEKVVHEQTEQYYDVEQRTAVEILQKGRYCMPSGFRDWIKERYGVEVDL
jgi:predicted RNase H-like nuclease (RuvC/YqgF family)